MEIKNKTSISLKQTILSEKNKISRVPPALPSKPPNLESKRILNAILPKKPSSDLSSSNNFESE